MLNYFLATYGMQLMTALLCALLGCLGYGVKGLVARYLTDEAKLSVARVAVKFVEQVWTTIHGPAKLDRALETAAAMLKKKGIDFDADEMEVLIEAAVAEFNSAMSIPLMAEDTADAVRRVDGGEPSIENVPVSRE